MARQIGDIKITGTVEGITFYRMGEGYYARLKSSLSGERVKRDKAFCRTMASALRLASGSQLASRVYRALDKGKRKYALYCELKRRAIYGLKEGKSEAEVLETLQAYLIETGVVVISLFDTPAAALFPKRDAESAAAAKKAMIGCNRNTKAWPRLFVLPGSRRKVPRQRHRLRPRAPSLWWVT